MPEYKRQHYLPTAYLKYFSVDQKKCNRDSHVWRFDGKIQRLVPIVSQCSGDYFYSKERPFQTEAMFQLGENAYCHCVDKIRSRGPLTGKIYGNLVLMMFDFHLRNAVHKNLTGKEGIDAYRLRNKIFMEKILLGRSDNITPAAVAACVEQNWSVRIISAMPNSMFITSDHPSVWTIVNPSRLGLQIVTLPLTPKHTAVAFDKRVLRIIDDQANLEDERTLNIGQIQNGEHCVYASNPFPDEQLAIIKNHFDRAPASPSEVYETQWNLPLQHLPKEHHFSFMLLNPQTGKEERT
jgi:hypothetical protein